MEAVVKKKKLRHIKYELPIRYQVEISTGSGRCRVVGNISVGISVGMKTQERLLKMAKGCVFIY